jgi:hypothetical protein
MYILWI